MVDRLEKKRIITKAELLEEIEELRRGHERQTKTSS